MMISAMKVTVERIRPTDKMVRGEKTSREMKEALKRAAGMAQRKREEVEYRETN